MKMNLLNFMNPKNRKRDGAEGKKKSVADIQRTKEVIFVSKYMEELAPDVLQISQKVMGLGRRPLDKATEQENEDYHRRRFREHVSGMKTSYENAANGAR